jgi:hypothetical protein
LQNERPIGDIIMPLTLYHNDMSVCAQKVMDEKGSEAWPRVRELLAA